MNKQFHTTLLTLLLLPFSALPALAQTTTTEERPAITLTNNCIVSILNRSIHPSSGGFVMNNLRDTGRHRGRATCFNADGTVSTAQTDYFTLLSSTTVNVSSFFINNGNVPFALNINNAEPVELTTSGETLQLTVEATFIENTLENVEASENVTLGVLGTNYSTTNNKIASVSENGLVTALKSGQVTVIARKDGVVAFKPITVILAGDNDNDGIPDAIEMANGLNPNDPSDAYEDQDRDGLSARDEYVAGTDIHIADSDGDGLSDGEELTLGVDGVITNPLIADTNNDTDGDGIENTQDNCPLLANNNQLDTDNDTQGNVCDTDDDNDDVLDIADNCPLTYVNPSIYTLDFNGSLGLLTEYEEGNSLTEVYTKGLSIDYIGSLLNSAGRLEFTFDQVNFVKGVLTKPIRYQSGLTSGFSYQIEFNTGDIGVSGEQQFYLGAQNGPLTLPQTPTVLTIINHLDRFSFNTQGAFYPHYGELESNTDYIYKVEIFDDHVNVYVYENQGVASVSGAPDVISMPLGAFDAGITIGIFGDIADAFISGTPMTFDNLRFEGQPGVTIFDSGCPVLLPIQ